MTSNISRINILSCPVDNLGLIDTISIIDEIIRQRIPKQHVVINVDKLLKVRKDENLRKIIAGCRIINVDGMPIIWVSKLFGTPLKERVAGIDLMMRLIEHAWQNKYSLYFLGARNEVVQRLKEIYESKYPGLCVAGFRDGYWNTDEEKEVVDAIKLAHPDILMVAMSSPKKEIFIANYLSSMDVPFVMGVGGAFDVIVGRTKRSPLWVQKIGLEWFCRLIHEPKRLWRRYLIGNSFFICLVAKEFLTLKLLKLKNRKEYDSV